MKPNTDQPKTPESKPKANDAAQNRLTEDGPNGGKNKKVNPFRKFLNNLWGPICGCSKRVDGAEELKVKSRRQGTNG